MVVAGGVEVGASVGGGDVDEDVSLPKKKELLSVCESRA